MPGDVVIYCDEASDELLAEEWLQDGPLMGARIQRLPTLAAAPDHLKSLLHWERQDWTIVDGERVLCTVEFSRHGYTGDNGFQRFARLYRAASLGIPNVYYTPFSRSRNNELEAGIWSERNVAPELFRALFAMSETFRVPCLAIPWPTDSTGTPTPMTDTAARVTLSELVEFIHGLVAGASYGDNASVADDFRLIVSRMQTQADLPFRGSETRGIVELPIELASTDWIWDWLPEQYFRGGKADKALASLVLRSQRERPVEPKTATPFWGQSGRARVSYIGYQWRPDPACGLVALSAAEALREGLPLIVVWPRVFLRDGPERQEALKALRDFKEDGRGPLASELRDLGKSTGAIAKFRARLSIADAQFGVLGSSSKAGRILAETASAVVLGDMTWIPS